MLTYMHGTMLVECWVLTLIASQRREGMTSHGSNNWRVLMPFQVFVDISYKDGSVDYI